MRAPHERPTGPAVLLIKHDVFALRMMRQITSFVCGLAALHTNRQHYHSIQKLADSLADYYHAAYEKYASDYQDDLGAKSPIMIYAAKSLALFRGYKRYLSAHPRHQTFKALNELELLAKKNRSSKTGVDLCALNTLNEYCQRIDRVMQQQIKAYRDTRSWGRGRLTTLLSPSSKSANTVNVQKYEDVVDQIWEKNQPQTQQTFGDVYVNQLHATLSTLWIFPPEQTRFEESTARQSAKLLNLTLIQALRRVCKNYHKPTHHKFAEYFKLSLKKIHTRVVKHYENENELFQASLLLQTLALSEAALRYLEHYDSDMLASRFRTLLRTPIIEIPESKHNPAITDVLALYQQANPNPRTTFSLLEYERQINRDNRRNSDETGLRFPVMYDMLVAPGRGYFTTKTFAALNALVSKGKIALYPGNFVETDDNSDEPDSDNHYGYNSISQ